MKSSRHNCYKCGACVCEKCSQNKIQLSLTDDKKYRVCNSCFVFSTNKPIITFYVDLLDAKKMKIEGLRTRRSEYEEKLR